MDIILINKRKCIFVQNIAICQILSNNSFFLRTKRNWQLRKKRVMIDMYSSITGASLICGEICGYFSFFFVETKRDCWNTAGIFHIRKKAQYLTVHFTRRSILSNAQTAFHLRISYLKEIWFEHAQHDIEFQCFSGILTYCFCRNVVAAAAAATDNLLSSFRECLRSVCTAIDILCWPYAWASWRKCPENINKFR